MVLAKAFHMENHYKTFYYLTGMIFSLSITGLISCIQITGSNRNCDEALQCNNCSTLDCYICQDCCLQSCCRGYGGPLIFDGDCCVGCCRCCTGEACAGCSLDTSAAGCTGLSAECAPVLIVIVMIFAFFGLLVSVIAGTAYIQRIAQRHVHILQKKQLTQQFIVKDLDDGALSTEQQIKLVLGEDISVELDQIDNSVNIGNDTNDVILSIPLRRDGSNNDIYSPITQSDEYINNLENQDELQPSAPLLSEMQRKELSRLGLIESN
jgi:hypothetical protein